MRRLILLLVTVMALVQACAPQPLPSSPTPNATATAPAPLTPTRAPATLTPTATPPPTLTPTPSPTPDAYAGLGIADLAARSYGGGELRIQQTLGVNAAFTRTLITYPSDKLTIYGFMDVPRGAGPFPVIVALHGYLNPAVYNTLDYTTRYADALAQAGYLVIHPNLRGYKPSDDGPNLFRVGFAVDVMNLIAIVRDQAGKPGPLQAADPKAIGLWGHSMGGGVSIRVLTISRNVRAAVLYGAMSGDEQKNYEMIKIWSGNTRGLPESEVPAGALRRISPINFLDRITAAVSINHGANDPEVPPEWSRDLCQRLQALGKSVECWSYPGEPHTFIGQGDRLFIQRTVAFFDKQLKGH